MYDSENAGHEKANFKWWVGLVIVGIGALWLLNGLVAYVAPHPERGTFGDTFGVVNALFSGLAFAGVVIAILLQRQDLIATRRELEGQKEQLSRQANQLERQAFENTFFQMLGLHSDIVKSFSYKPVDTGRMNTGKNCFVDMKHDFLTEFFENKKWGSSSEARYKNYYFRNVHQLLGQYFRNLYELLKYVKNSTVTDKKFYTDIVRAQLSSAELFVMFFHTLSELGSEEYRRLIQEFQFLEHLPQAGEIKKDDALKYGKQAFGHNANWAAYLSEKPE